MRNHAALLLGVLLFGVALFAQAKDQEPPSLVFGGKKLYVGMSKGEAVAALSGCCKLSPPADSDTEKQPAQEGMMLGHFILAKDKSSSQILGTITFSRGRVVRITRPLATEVDTSNEDLVSFVRAITRSLPPTATTAWVSLKHERMSNAESDVVLLVFPDGRGMELHIGTLDKPMESTNKRDFVTLDETLE